MNLQLSTRKSQPEIAVFGFFFVANKRNLQATTIKLVQTFQETEKRKEIMQQTSSKSTGVPK